MLEPWLELPGAGERLAAWSEISNLDLARLGTVATADEITDTAVTQPLVVATTLLAHEELTKRGLLSNVATVVAGHSVGEIAAYAIAGVITADEAVSLAAVRGAEMAKACASEPTGMAAVLGGDEAEVLARLDAFDLVAANRNAAGQIVAAGRLDALATAGAFHTHYMASALGGYSAAAQGVVGSEPTSSLLSNADGLAVSSAQDAMEKLVAQLTRPVRWDLCTETIRSREVSAIVEFPPAGTLVGIAKRELRGVPTYAVKTPADLDGLAELAQT
jgi:[acyl-carrier-protein] S-malonyltransferase